MKKMLFLLLLLFILYWSASAREAKVPAASASRGVGVENRSLARYNVRRGTTAQVAERNGHWGRTLSDGLIRTAEK